MRKIKSWANAFSRLLNQGCLHIWLTVRNVVAHRVVEQDRLLRYLRYLAAQRGQREVANILTIDLDAADVTSKKTRN